MATACFNTGKGNSSDYEDYDPEDFYEVTGRLIENRLSYHFPKTNIIYYEYFLEKETPLKGSEENIKPHLKKGEKFIVLVHKKDSCISFFGYTDPRFRKNSFQKVKARK
ncbi:hypothetical protein GCM10023115_41420 [Pontixanthobacter gangjinensis]|uniref:Uncharacterized protein n=1 Tax=Christiangramia aestuarii TaxID=1028746 RepID=A0A7K1LRN8_9FLAO|nr:hypothetical protein [Christiangramia aestuarii]MUP43472.1 hypothetical protein [Christiangramia aestuarii]